MADSINAHGLPSYVEHDQTQTPIGRAVRSWVEELPDGESAVKVEMELFKSVPVYGITPTTDGVLPRGRAPSPGEITISGDAANHLDESAFDALASAAEALGPVKVDRSLIRRAAVPDPQLVIAFGTMAAATFVMLRGFFSGGVSGAPDPSDEYLDVRERLVDVVVGSEPLDATPITDLTFTLEHEGQAIEVYGSLKGREPDAIRRFADSGLTLLAAAVQAVAVLPRPTELTRLQFNFEPNSSTWNFEYGMHEGNEPFMAVSLLDS